MPSSTTSSTHSEIESLKDLIGNEEIRYVRKGYGLIIASLLTIGYFGFLPKVVYRFYEDLPYTNKFLFKFIGTYAIHFLTFVIANLAMYVIYRSELPFFERYKIVPKPWPWKENPEEFQAQLKKTMKNLLLNQGVLVPLVILVPTYFELDTYSVKPEEFPSVLQLLVQITFFMIVEDTCFYWVHRLFHSKALYRRFHKQHHEFKTTIGIASEYSHPVEFFFANVLPTSMGPLLLGNCHIVAYWLWLVMRVLETIDGHCGYEFSWSPFRLLPLSGSANYHNFHHSHNVGNFGSFFTYWDTICKTNIHYWRHMVKCDKLQ